VGAVLDATIITLSVLSGKQIKTTGDEATGAPRPSGMYGRREV